MLWDIFCSWRRKLNRKMAHRRENAEYRAILAKMPPVTLTEDEKSEVLSIWGQLGLKINMDVHRMMKAWGYFDARVVPFPMQALIHPILVSDEYLKVMSHKSLVARLYADKIRMPRTFVSCIDAVCYDSNGEHISFDDAVGILHGNDFFIKPSIGTYGGAGVHKVSAGLPKNEIADMLKGYRGNFLASEIFRQHPKMAFANPTSVNTMRLNTLWLNGRVSVVSAMFRYGAKGAIVDNLGSGGITATVTENGDLLPTVIFDKGYGFGEMDSKLREYYGTKFTFFDVAAEYACKMHERHFALAKTLPWDIAIDEEGRPVVIEINFGDTGTMFCEPVFGSRTQEVIDFVKPRLHWLYTKHRPELNLEYSIYDKK